MKYKVCILSAGVGSRMGSVTDHINKSLLPVNFKAVISHIIEKFDKDIEFVIAVGHNEDTVKDYISLAHPDRKFTYITVDNYIGPGSGPGYSLLQCKNELKCPFIFFTSDTLVLESIPEPSKNWFGVAPVKSTKEYCTVKVKNNLISQLDDKIVCDNKNAFIGLAGVYDFKDFFDALTENKEIKNNEIQVSNGFSKLIEKKLHPNSFTWFDTGTKEKYLETNKNFLGNTEKFDFTKADEFIYFVNNRVIKYFADETITKKRFERSNYLEGLCPKIENKLGKFYSYKLIDGQVVYDVLNTQVMNDFLMWAKQELWTKEKLNVSEQKEFDLACKKFYSDKTNLRLEKFYNKTGVVDSESTINGVNVPSLKDLFNKIDWENLYSGIPSNFHGDLQFDNVLYTKDKKSNLDKFVLIDWRQEFAGLTKYGDLYYDLAKMYGGLTISYKLIKQELFSFDMSGNKVFYKYEITNNLVESREKYEQFIIENGYDLKKVKLLTGIIFLNMSPMHNDPFDLMIYFMGKLTIHKALNEK
jgi:NDP-sugar pyrophosphorylase family protein/thiamine kinase-like enzyme